MNHLNSVILSAKPAAAPAATGPAGLPAPDAEAQAINGSPAFAGLLQSRLAKNVAEQSGNPLPEAPALSKESRVLTEITPTNERAAANRQAESEEPGVLDILKGMPAPENPMAPQPSQATQDPKIKQALNAETATQQLKSRLLQGGLKVIVGGSTPSDAGVDDFARSQGIDPQALALLLGDSKKASHQWDRPASTESTEASTKPESDPVAVWLSESAIPQLVREAPAAPTPIRQTIETYLQAPNKFMPIDKQVKELVDKLTFKVPASKAIAESFVSLNTSPQQQPTIKLENINLVIKDALNGPRLKSPDSTMALPTTTSVTAAAVPATVASVPAPVVISEAGYVTAQPTFDGRSEYSGADTLPEQLEQQNLRKQEEQADMSRRLAEALGQRLSAQISRGAWRVEMDLHPKSLGRIEIQLEMKNGELEANFIAANAATRELLQDSMPRLRAAFEEHGMESAYIGLGLENQAQSDGNSTGQDSSKEDRISSDSEEPELNDETVRPNNNGLDLLV